VGSQSPQRRSGRHQLRSILNTTTGTISLTSAATLTPGHHGQSRARHGLLRFWDSNHTWTVISSSGSGTVTGTALGTTNNYSSYGTFSTAINGNNLDLTWTAIAIPEPSTYAASSARSCSPARLGSAGGNARHSDSFLRFPETKTPAEIRRALCF